MYRTSAISSARHQSNKRGTRKTRNSSSAKTPVVPKISRHSVRAWSSSQTRQTMSVFVGASQDGDLTRGAVTWFASSKVHAGLPPLAGEASPRKNTTAELASVRKSSVLSLQELELESAGKNGLPPQKKKNVIVSRRSSSGFPVSQQEDLNFRVTDRQNGSVIYLPQAHARALEPSPLSSHLVPAAMMTRPAIARRRSGESPSDNEVAQVQHRRSASGLPLPQLTRRETTRRSIAEAQDSFRENMRRRKSSKYASTYSPREGSRAPKNNSSDNGGGAVGTGANGRHHTDGHMCNKAQHAIMKAKSCCIL